MHWIMDAILRACEKMQTCDLDVRIVNYGDYVDPSLRELEKAVAKLPGTESM